MKRDIQISSIQHKLQDLEQYRLSGNESLLDFKYGALFGKLLTLRELDIINTEEYLKYNKLLELARFGKEVK